MRIALVHPFEWPVVRRGGERYLDDLQWYLRGAGHDVTVVAGADPTPNAVARRLGIDPSEAFGLRAYRALRGERFDVAHALVPSAAMAARAAKIPTVYTVLGHPSRASMPGTVLGRRLLRAAVAKADLVAVLSESARVATQQMFGRDSSILPPGIRHASFTPNRDARTGPPRILFPASNDTGNKGLQHLLPAFAIVLRTQPDARLVLGGPGDHTWAVRESGVPDDVMRNVDVVGVGDVEDVPAMYANATVTVLPSRDEAFGLVLIESMAAGTPVVGGAGSGAEDLITDDIGRLVAFGDREGLASAIVDVIGLASQPGVAQLCNETAKRWDWTAVIGPAHEAIYEQVAR